MAEQNTEQGSSRQGKPGSEKERLILREPRGKYSKNTPLKYTSSNSGLPPIFNHPIMLPHHGSIKAWFDKIIDYVKTT